MNITVQRADLARVLGAVSRVVERRNTIPILANVHLSAGTDTLTARATDLDIEISASLPATVAKSGETTVDAARLLDFVKRVSGDTIDIGLADDTLTLKAGRNRAKLPTLPADEYPTLNVGAFTTEFDLDLADFVAPVAYAQSTEETRYYLNGVYLHSTTDGLIAVATTGHVLAKRTGADIGTVPASIIPRKAIAVLPKGEARVSLSSSKIRVASGDTVLTSKLIDGTFPDYGRVIPLRNDKVVRVDKTALSKATDLAMTVSEGTSKTVRLEIAPGGIQVSSRGPGGEAGADIATDYSGEPITIGFNGAYLVSTLAAFGGAEVDMCLADPGSPAVFQAGGDLLAVVMPMRAA
ncbi:DNA polymerase III subunit beta [Ancylobacter polymorphus]|uniref:Beta sliding clamp n=1 Tax=Ancylobacter polymorphus TaxID=223390 RepID=A0A9E6ZTY7_9HYPH|nr:DNA polymerase III subunit beta [Ancylobacter polymorphus]UOK71684.1 DNA polymerase III subunit beta [Ancylobacter polymorphus]